MTAVVDELCAVAAGGRIQKILQPAPLAVGLAVYKEGRQRWILLSADPRAARVQVTERLAKAFPTPSPFIMLMRKYLDGARIMAVEQEPFERVLTLVVGHDEHEARLVTEVMGKHSNIIVVNRDGRILGAIKSVSERETRVRPVLPGRTYRLPPTQERAEFFGRGPRLNPVTSGTEIGELLSHVPPGTPARQALIGLLPGASPALVDEIMRRAGVRELDDESVPALLDAAREMYRLWETREWHPVSFVNERGRADFAPYVPMGRETREWPSMSEAIAEVSAGVESRDALGTLRAAILGDIGRRRAAAERRVASMREGLEATSEAEDVMQHGQLVLAYQHAIEPQATELDLPDLGMTIALDPAMTAVENAERLFRRYRKLRDGRARLPGLLVAAERERDDLAEMESFARLAESEADLRALERELKPEPGTKKGVRAKRGPTRYRRGDISATAGRSARENEEVTFRIAARDDWWLHARERTGAHVVIPGNAPEGVVGAAAALAGYLSEGRNDTRVDVDVARVRDVRKISGGPPGKVTYRNFRTMTVQPSMEGWEKVR